MNNLTARSINTKPRTTKGHHYINWSHRILLKLYDFTHTKPNTIDPSTWDCIETTINRIRYNIHNIYTKPRTQRDSDKIERCMKLSTYIQISINNNYRRYIENG